MIDPELHPYLEMWTAAWAPLPPDAPATARRALLERLSDEARVPLPPGVTSDVFWVERPGRSVRVRRFRRDGAPPSPCLIYMHGGGWMQGSPETHDAITAAITGRTGWTVLSVDYALAPEHPYPAALDDCEAVLRHAAATAETIVVGGDSAGANLAAALTLRLRGTPLAPAGQMLFYPPVDHETTRPSFAENAEGPIIRTAQMPATLAQYCPDPEARRGPEVSPIRAASHAGLPPAFVAVAEHDPLRDDGIDYAGVLSAAGVPVALHRGTGLIHGYLRATSYCAAARQGLEAACAWLSGIRRPA